MSAIIKKSLSGLRHIRHHGRPGWIGSKISLRTSIGCLILAANIILIGTACDLFFQGACEFKSDSTGSYGCYNESKDYCEITEEVWGDAYFHTGLECSDIGYEIGEDDGPFWADENHKIPGSGGYWADDVDSGGDENAGYSYTYTCPGEYGGGGTIDIPPGTTTCQKAYENLAYVFGCNLVDDMNSAGCRIYTDCGDANWQSYCSN